MKMQTPLPVQLEYWIKIAENKKSPYDLRQNAILHLKTIRDTIDKVLVDANRPAIRTIPKVKTRR
jgi:hypothetical protein